MDLVLITYDLHDQGDKRRSKLRDAIRRDFPRYYEHVELSVYLVGTMERPSVIRDGLQRLLQDGDKLYVGKITSSAWAGDPGLKAWIEETRAKT